MAETTIEIFSTCPQSKDVQQAEYLEQVAQISRWSEDAGYRGMLVYTDNGLVDPWLVSQVVLENTKTLAPLIAIQPIYMHPYTAAKMVASYAFLARHEPRGEVESDRRFQPADPRARELRKLRS